jgi:ribonuclease HII
LQLYREGLKVVAGVDEAGRGCLAGPLVAAAVVLAPHTFIFGINDSKLLTALARERLAKEIKEKAVCWSVAVVEAAEIDRLGITAANILALEKAVAQLPQPPEVVISDYFSLNSGCRCLALVKGDQLSQSVAAASIVAKVYRDELMVGLDKLYPGYGFKEHKGYATEGHWQTLNRKGPSKVHRQTFLSKWRQAALPNLDF